MTASIHIREARFPEDFPVMAAVITAERVNWPVSAEELTLEHEARDPKYLQWVLLAEMDGEVIGVGSAGHIPYAHREGRFGFDLRVPPDYQGQGAGKSLYEALLERLAPHHPRELITEVWEAVPRAVRFVEDRGFQAAWRRVDSSLDVHGFDFTPFAGLEARLRTEGIEVLTYSQLADDPEHASKLHALDWSLLQDMPFGETQTLVPLDQFIGETLQSPAFLPDACFIARSGQEWIGYSNLLRGEDFFVIQMTGTLRAWRGRGVATLLKLKGIEYSLAHGGLELRTTNDSVNTAMIEINRRLGFKETGASIRYKKTMG